MYLIEAHLYVKFGQCFPSEWTFHASMNTLPDTNERLITDNPRTIFITCSALCVLLLFCFFYIIFGYTKSDVSQEIIYIHVCLRKVILLAGKRIDYAH